MLRRWAPAARNMSFGLPLRVELNVLGFTDCVAATAFVTCTPILYTFQIDPEIIIQICYHSTIPRY